MLNAFPNQSSESNLFEKKIYKKKEDHESVGPFKEINF